MPNTIIMPKLIHYVWMGNDIDPILLRSILANKTQNPDYKTIIWTDRETSITNTLNKFETQQNQLPFEIRSLDKLFQDLKNSPLGYKKLNNDSYVSIAARLESVFTREKNGVYHNYAAASDVARLVIMYMEGGLYLDVDVVMKVPIEKLSTSNWQEKLSKNGLGMYVKNFTNESGQLSQAAGNAILAGIPKSKQIVFQLVHIANCYDDNNSDLFTESINFSEHHWEENHQFDISYEDDSISTLKEKEYPTWTQKRANYNEESNFNRLDGTMFMTGPESYMDNCKFLDFTEIGSYDQSITTQEILGYHSQNMPKETFHLGYTDEPDGSANWLNNKPTINNGARASEISTFSRYDYSSTSNKMDTALYKFITNPIEFLKRNTVSYNISIQPITTLLNHLLKTDHINLLHLNQTAPHVYQLEHKLNSDPAAIQMYLLGSEGVGQNSNYPSYLDIPENDPKNLLLITKRLEGASIIVTKTNEGTLRVYRDSRINSSILYDNVVMAIDFKDYKNSKHGGQANAFMHYSKSDKQWKLILQKQEGGGLNNTTTHLNTVTTYHMHDTQEIITTNNNKFKDFQNTTRQRLLTLANELGIKSDINSTNANPDDWKILRNNIDEVTKQKLTALYIQQSTLKDKQKKFSKWKILNPNSKTSQLIIEAQLKLIDLEIGVINKSCSLLIEESKRVDNTWFWKQEKDSKGFAAVVQNNEKFSIKGVKYSTLNAAEGLLRRIKYYFSGNDAQKKEFSEGYKLYQEVFIPGYDGKLTLKELYELYHNNDKKSVLSFKQQGALLHHIETTIEGTNILSTNEYINTGIKVLSQNGGIVKKTSQILYGMQVHDYKGRCLPLAMLMIAGLENGDSAVNNLIANIEKATIFPNDSGSILLRNALRDSHEGFERMLTKPATKKNSISNILHLLKQGKKSRAGVLLTETHAMVISYTIKDDQTEVFSFYDPNFGLAKYESIETANKSINSLFRNMNLEIEYKTYTEDGRYYTKDSTGLPFFDFELCCPHTIEHFMLNNFMKVGNLFDDKPITKLILENRNLQEIIEDIYHMGGHEALTSLSSIRSVLNKFENTLETADTTDQWTPVLKSIERLEDGNYRMLYVNNQSPQEDPKWVLLEDADYINLKKSVDNLVNKKIRIDEETHLTQEMLLGAKSFSEIFDELQTLKKNQEPLNKQFKEIKFDADLSRVQSIQEQSYLAENFLEAAENLYKENAIDLNAIPVLEAIKETTNEFGSTRYEIPFINPTEIDKQKIHWVSTSDSIFIKIKKYVKNYAHIIINRKAASSGVHGVDTIQGTNSMNSGFALMQLITWFNEHTRNKSTENTIPKNLAIALTAHSYLNIAQIGQGTVQDATEMIGIIRGLANTNTTAETPTFMKGLGKAQTGAGVLLGLGAIGLDAYELVHAQNDIQKAVFGTQLGFDSAALILNVASIGANAVGATTVAGILGPLGVPLAGIGVGAAGLAQVYGEFAADTKIVADYFEQMDNAYAKGYNYDNKNDNLIVLTGAVVKVLDLESNCIEFDSQLMYSSEYSSLAFMDDTRDNSKRSDTFEVRKALNYTSKLTIKPQESKALVVILPNTPKSYINHYREKIIGVRESKGKGYDILRRVEKNSNGKFKFEHFFFPYDSIIRNTSQEYIDTTVEVNLGAQDRILVIPELPKTTSAGRDGLYRMHAFDTYMKYNIKSKGGRYAIRLNTNAVINLITIGKKKSTWTLDTSQLQSEIIEKITGNQLVIGGVTINVDENSTIRIVSKNGETKEVDFSTQAWYVITEIVDQWSNTSKDSIDEHLRKLAKEHHLSGKYVTVDNYMHNDKKTGRAFYDVRNQQMLFTAANEVLININTLLEKINEKPLITFQKITTCYESDSGTTVGHGFGGYYPDETIDIITYEAKITQPEILAQCIELLSIDPLLSYQNMLINRKRNLEDKVLLLNNQLSLMPSSTSYLPNKSEKERVDISDANLPNNIKTQNNKILNELKALVNETLSQCKDILGQIKIKFIANEAIKDSMLGGVVGNEAFFYSSQQALVWKVDIRTGKVKNQYFPHIRALKNDHTYVWKEGDKIYMTISYDGKNNDKGDLTYLIDNDVISLISIRADAATGSKFIDNILNNNNNTQLQKINEQYTNLQLFKFLNTQTTEATISPLVSLYGKNVHNIRYHTWLKSDNNTTTVIKADLENMLEDTVTHLLLVANMRADNGSDIFYFFDSVKKELYQQKGTGPEILDPNKPTAVCIAQKIVNVHTIGNRLVAVTEDGLINEVDIEGKLHLNAVNQTWLNKQGTSWYKNLHTLKSIKPIAIYGIKKSDQISSLPMWYYNKKILVAPAIQSDSIEFVSANKFNPIYTSMTSQQALEVLFDYQEGVTSEMDREDRFEPVEKSNSIEKISYVKDFSGFIGSYLKNTGLLNQISDFRISDLTVNTNTLQKAGLHFIQNRSDQGFTPKAGDIICLNPNIQLQNLKRFGIVSSFDDLNKTLTIISLNESTAQTTSETHTLKPEMLFFRAAENIKSETPKLEDINNSSNTSAEYAYLYDAANGKLYKQSFIGISLDKNFTENQVLINSSTIPNAVDLFPAEKFKSVFRQETGLIRLVTQDGAILVLDNDEKVRLIGVDKTWQTYYPDATKLGESIRLLVNKWAFEGEVIIMQNDSTDEAPSWYSLKLNKKITAQALKSSDSPEFVGLATGNHNTGVYINSTQGLNYYQYDINGNITQQSADKKTVQRFGTAMLINGTNENDTLQPLPIDNVSSTILSGGEGQDTYMVTKEIKEKIKKIIIENFSKDKKMDKINLHTSINEHVIVSQKEDDLLIFSDDSIVVIKKVFGENVKSYNHLQLITTDGKSSWKSNITDLTSRIEKFQISTDNSSKSYYLSTLDYTYEYTMNITPVC